MKKAVKCLLVVVIAHSVCSDSIEVNQKQKSQGCSLSELPTYRNLSCMDARDKPVVAHSVMSVNTMCTFTCNNGVKTWAYCQNNEWSVHNQECIPQEVRPMIKRPLVRKKRFFGFIFRIIKCIFTRCRRRRPRDRTTPSLHCPNSISKIGDKRQTSTKVWWTKPQAHDDRDGAVGTYSLYGHFPGQLFGEGSRRVGYYARDRSNNMARCYFTITVTVTRCKSVHRVSNGYVICHPSTDMVRGTVCRYGCYTGHVLKGVSYSVCNDFERWTGWTIVQPYCEKLTCPVLTPTGKISVQCSDTNKFRSICTLSCPEGYDIPTEHPRVRICQADGSWSGRETYCKDIEKPTFKTCPSVYTFYVSKYEENTTVYWNIPEVEDNSGATIHSVQTSGPLSHTVQPVGVYTVTFSATDATGNVARDCQTKIIVKQTRCFMVYPTPYTVVNCTGNRYGSTCRFGCTDDAELQGNHAVSCERQGDPPFGYWTWGDIQPHCTLTEKCPSLTAPKYGALSCDIWVGGRFCQMQCQEGYDVRHFPGLTVCSNDGEWIPKDNIKHCRKSSRSRKTKTRLDIYYYTGKCSSETTQMQIKQNFISIFQSSNLYKLCQPQSGCYWQMVKVVCGATDKKRSADDTVVQTEIIYETEVVNDKTFKEIVDNHTANLKILSEDIKSGNLNIKFDNETLQPSKIKENELNIDCQNNTVPSLSTFSCVECTSGSYYDKLQGDCADCPRGTFQSTAGQSECISCPEKLSTADMGATSIDRCSDACPPGSWSANSLLPCTACDVGTYQNKYGATKCFECSGGKLTNADMSTTAEQCKEFDIMFPQNETLGIYLHLQQLLVIEEFSITARFQCLDKCNGTLFNIENAGQSVLSLELGNSSSVSISGSQFEVSNTSVLDGQWHSLVLSKTKTHALLFLDSRESFNSCITDAGYFNISHIKLGESFEGVISQFNIFSNETFIQDLQSFSEKCFNEDVGDIINWKDFKNAVLNNAFIQIPSQCDDIDECSSSPCINGTCTDALLSYTCSCDIGYTGQNCDVDIDDCNVNSCQNNATCIDGTANYTCDCQPLYRGQFCETEQVDGNWSEWGNWSECSATCGNGSITRSRACDSPAPDNGGQECKGNDTEFDTCVMEECRVCSNLTEPDNSFLNCTETENMIQCTLTCDEGYDFDHAPPDMYTCGNETGHRWDFKADDNSKTALPTCSATEDGDKMEFKHTASYVNLRCSDHSNLKELITSKVTSAVQRVTCMKENMCSKKEISVTNCNSKRRKRDTSVTTGFYVVLQCLPKDHGTITCYEGLNEAAYEIQQLENNDTLTLSLGGVEYIVNTNTSDFDDVLTCSVGSVPVYAYCVPCAPGRYFTDESCKLCDNGYYQDQFKKTTCKTCPPGLTTPGTGSTNSTDCTIPRSIVKESEVSEESDSSVIAIVLGTSLPVLFVCALLLCIVAVTRYKLKKQRIDAVWPYLQRRNEKTDKNRRIIYVREASDMRIINSQPPISTKDVSLRSSSTNI